MGSIHPLIKNINNTMKLSTHRLFAQLCESLLTEVSSSMPLVQKNPGGKEVIQTLHTGHYLAHDQKYRPVPQISWSEVKEYYNGAWIIIVGTTGTAAIRSTGGTTGNYNIFASDGGEVQSTTKTNATETMAFLKNIIGKPTQFYVGEKNDNISTLKNLRKTRTTNNNSNITPEKLVEKFRPLWIKAVTAAIAEVKGMSITMIRNDSFEKARTKIKHAEELEQVLLILQGQRAPDVIKSSVTTAISMAAHYHYPELTGEITKGYNGYQAQYEAGPRKLMSDIAGGDTQKLGTILGFFKRNLISG